MFKTCLRTAGTVYRRSPLPPSCTCVPQSLRRAASTATNIIPANLQRGSSSNKKASASSVKKSGPYASNIKTQLKQDRSSIIRHTTPDGQAISFSTAERYDIDSLRKALWDQRLLGRGDGNDAMNLMGEAIWIPKWPVEDASVSTIATINESENDSSLQTTSDTSGEIFVFENGSFVSWHMSTADAQAFADRVLKKNDIPVEIERYDEPQIEAMGFVVQSGEKTGVKEDMIVIGTTSEVQDMDEKVSDAPPLATAIDPLPVGKSSASILSGYSAHQHIKSRVGTTSNRHTILPRSEDDLRARLSLSSGLARSTKLAVYEEMLDAHMDEVSYIPNALSSGDEGPLKKKDILKNTGNLLRIRQHIYLQEENLIDPPEMFWANASLEIWFHQMSRALDVDLRMRNLKTKVDYSLELQNTLLDLNSTKVSHRLEWIIIILIAIEIVMALMREGLPGFNRHNKIDNIKEADMKTGEKKV